VAGFRHTCTNKNAYESLGKFHYDPNKFQDVLVMDKQIRISTHGRLTIPKKIRDSLRVEDGQPVLVRSDSAKREITLVLQPVMSDYR
jgi:AbrB family looped-hinge helix DNA binding protein